MTNAHDANPGRVVISKENFETLQDLIRNAKQICSICDHWDNYGVTVGHCEENGIETTDLTTCSKWEKKEDD